MVTAPWTEERSRRTEALTAEVTRLLGHEDSYVIGAVLAVAVASWLKAHETGRGDEANERAREDILATWLKMLDKLLRIKE